MSDKKRGFTALVLKSGKITIPHMLRKILKIKKGDMVDISEIVKLEVEKETV